MEVIVDNGVQSRRNPWCSGAVGGVSSIELVDLGCEYKQMLDAQCAMAIIIVVTSH